MSDFFQYIFLGSIYGTLIVIIRIVIRQRLKEIYLKTEKEALDYMRELLCLCQQKGKSSAVELSRLVIIHKRKCWKQQCDCRTIFSKGYLDRASLEVIKLNYSSFDTTEDLPKYFKNCWKLQALKILLSELMPVYNTASCVLHLAMSEVLFYYFANHFQAISQAETLPNQSFVCAQRTVNLRETIEEALANSKQPVISLAISSSSAAISSSEIHPSSSSFSCSRRIGQFLFQKAISSSGR